MPVARLFRSPGNVPRSCIPVLRVHRNARVVPEPVQRTARVPMEPLEEPTICPALLIPKLSLALSPPNIPKSCMPPARVHIKACTDVAVFEEPTIWPEELRLSAALYVPPGNVP